MSMNQDVFFAKTPQFGKYKFTNSDTACDYDGANTQAIAVAGSDNSVLRNIIVTNSDTVTRDVAFFLYDGTTKYCIGTVPLAAGAGFTAGVSSVNGLNNTYLTWLCFDKEYNKTFLLKNGWSLYVGMLVVPASGKKVSVVCIYQDIS